MEAGDKKRRIAVFLGSALMLAVVACTCGPLQQAQEFQATVGSAQSTIAPMMTELEQNQPTYEAQATELQLTLTASGGGIGAVSSAVAGAEGGQWASSATASSQYGDDSWAASQATGAPNTPNCGDAGTAWASYGSTTQESLTLKYDNPVVPTSIVIHQTYNPGSIVKVEVSGLGGGPVTVYEGQASGVSTCPYNQVIDISIGSVTFPVDTVIISLDQSVVGNWNEIDAVQLVGVGQ